MTKAIVCEECDASLSETLWRGLDGMCWYDLRTVDGSAVGHYCSPECIAKGIAGWEQVMADTDDEAMADAGVEAV